MKLAAALLLASAFLFAQSEKLEFEAASVKPSAPPDGKFMIMNGGRGGPGSNDPTRFTFTNVTISQLVARAYNIRNYQLTAPSWMDQERFDVEAKIPTGATKEQANIMLQNLLAERFHLVVQHGTKEFQGYELVVAKGGPKLKESSPEDAAYDQSQPRTGPPPPPPPPGQPMKLDRPGLMMMMRIGGKGMIAQMTARAQTMQRLIDAIANNLNRPVIDKTGLTGKYDFTLSFSADTPAGMPALPPPPPGVTAPSVDNPEDLAPTLPDALPEQLGLRLEAKKIPLPTITVEKADKTPTEN